MLQGDLDPTIGIVGNFAFQFLVLWLYRRTGVWFPAAIWHATLNTVGGEFLFPMVDGADQDRLDWKVDHHMIIAIALVLAGFATAPREVSDSLLARVERRLRAEESRLIDFRRDLHQHPEGSGAEERTAGQVAARLRRGSDPLLTFHARGADLDLGRALEPRPLRGGFQRRRRDGISMSGRILLRTQRHWVLRAARRVLPQVTQSIWLRALGRLASRHPRALRPGVCRMASAGSG